MIRAAMRTPPITGPRILKFTSIGTIQFDKTPYAQLGYVNYDVIVVGAVGGRSGTAYGAPTGRHIVYGAGGGGGGFARKQGLLSDLDIFTTLTVGAQGKDGTDAGDNDKAGNGLVGGDSYFGTLGGYGGKGAIGGLAQGVPGEAQSPLLKSDPCIGGIGGGNTLNLGASGTGGRQGDSDGGSVQPPVAPTKGTATGMGQSGGKGGGGGAGRFIMSGRTLQVEQPGAVGSQGVGMDCSGGPPTVYRGGNGGGVNLISFLGFSEYYGGGVGSGNGVVCIKLT